MVAHWYFCDPHMQSHQYVSFNGRFRDTTTGYLVLWVNHAIYTYGGQYAGFIWLLARNSQLLKYQGLGFKYRPILYAYRLYYFIP